MILFYGRRAVRRADEKTTVRIFRWRIWTVFHV
ncbi:MAG: HIG1 domain-containing protein [Ruminiclostridium sp.]|nr:HIG1 domain-containing protein [Ruminiclostridium sp.]